MELVENIDHSATSFQIAPQSVVDLIKKYESLGLGLVGVFHTHLTENLQPSKKDLKFMELWGNELIWLIATKEILELNQVRGYFYENKSKKVKRLSISLEKSKKSEDLEEIFDKQLE